MNRDTAEVRVTEMPGTRAREWAEYHRDVAATTTYVYDFVWDITEDAEGPFCTDVDGNVLLDFTSHVAAAPLGYNNPKITDPMEAFDMVDPTKIAGQDFYVSDGAEPGESDLPGPADLMHELVDRTGHYGLDTVFLSNSGAEAVENAIKICYDASGGGKYGVTFDGAFHGRTLGALSLNRSKSVYRRDYPEIPGVHDVPYCDDRACSPETCSCGFFVDDGDTSILREKLDPKTGHIATENLSYIIMEPIQGEGGYRFPSDAFMQEVAALADEHDVPLVADEIQSGMGRTGEMWGSDHYPIEPDVITGAKGMRVGATIASEDTFPDERSRLSSTWGAGDIVSSALGVFTLRAIDEYDLLENAVVRGEQFKETVRDAALPGVADVRGKGLMLAVEFESSDRRDAVLEAALKRGLLTLACGSKVIRFLPPLDVTEREIEMGATILAEAAHDAA
ncbi:aspartate aminotransferase family protein [Halobaculum limi]|uniref:class-III pyridoxal-phosphate-dependent aminotransferase n=1 Tax=Halobaculum limi TaxID=3031916 RepID=UPI00240517A1|nr:aminotransferase class III-fold pyridoxal phosphate-dependent enzyme [Halobaculum sp. YSMS11]